MSEHEEPGQATPAAEMQIRWMIRRDMPEVLAIEQESFEFPWTEENFIKQLRQRNCIGMVFDEADQVRGFVIYELHATRLDVLNFAVKVSERRRGIGAAIVRKLIGKLSVNRRRQIRLNVRESNLVAQQFFRRHGFRAVGVLKGLYEDTNEDAYAMQFRYRPGEGEAGRVDTTKVSPAGSAKRQAGESAANDAGSNRLQSVGLEHAGSIRPCPFCGGVVVATTLLASGDGWLVACGECFARGPVKKAKAEAVEVWNEVWFPEGAT